MGSEPGAQGCVYFHGLPGSAAELTLVGSGRGRLPWVCDPLDYQRFAERAETLGPQRVIGLSLGAFSALQMAVHHPDAVSELVLISPAAPLELSAQASAMAGAVVFKAAKANRFVFAMLTFAQAALAIGSPRLLLGQMFANSCPAEKVLLQNPKFTRCLALGLRDSLWTNASTYRRAVRAYVEPWSQDLERVRCPCTLIHGELDDWVPLGMAMALAEYLPMKASPLVEEGLGHYSTLLKALPLVL